MASIWQRSKTTLVDWSLHSQISPVVRAGNQHVFYQLEFLGCLEQTSCPWWRSFFQQKESWPENLEPFSENEECLLCWIHYFFDHLKTLLSLESPFQTYIHCSCFWRQLHDPNLHLQQFPDPRKYKKWPMIRQPSWREGSKGRDVVHLDWI